MQALEWSTIMLQNAGKNINCPRFIMEEFGLKDYFLVTKKSDRQEAPFIFRKKRL
jgi:hypothetical protein